VLTDGPTASALTLVPNSHGNAVTVIPPKYPLCAGGIDGLTIEGSGHTDTGTLLEIVNAPGYRLNDVRLYNSGGRGLSLQGYTEVPSRTAISSTLREAKPTLRWHP